MQDVLVNSHGVNALPKPAGKLFGQLLIRSGHRVSSVNIAAYAAAGGIQAKILVPAATSPAKTVQMRAYGAEIELVPGTRQATSDEAIRQAERASGR